MRANYKAADRRLIRAVIERDYDAFEAALGRGADVEERAPREEDDWGAPEVHRQRIHALAHAIWSYSDEVYALQHVANAERTAFRIIERLVQAGADINAPCSEQGDYRFDVGPASLALDLPGLESEPLLDVLEFLVGRPDFSPPRQNTLLETAVRVNSTDAVRLLLQHPKLAVYGGSKAVINALQHRNVEMLRLLVEDGRVQLDVVDYLRLGGQYGQYKTVDALTLAVATGQTEATNILRAAGAPEERLRQWEMEQEEELIRQQAVRAAELRQGLMQGLRSERLVALAESPLGPHVNDVDSRGNTPLILAVRFRYVEVVRALLAQEEIDLTVRNRDGRTALGMAMHTNGKEIARLLRTAYAEP